jgi:methionine-rich copper-binding protein CopC
MRDSALRRLRPLPLTPWLSLVIAITLLRSPSVALAHAHYDHSTPAIGQVLAAAPSRVDIFTDSEMRKAAGANVIAVTASDGSRVDDGATVLDDADRRHFSVGLSPNLGPGRYVVAFQTLSDADGDADHGRFAFYIGNGPTPQQQSLDAGLNGVATTASTATPSPKPHAIGMPVAILVAALVIPVLLGAMLVSRKRQRGAHTAI